MPQSPDNSWQVSGYYSPRIEIVAIPPGEAPEEIRRQWIGLVVPALHDRPVRTETTGILTGPRTRFGWWLRLKLRRTETMLGYRVNARTAIETLELSAPEAATWWRSNRPDLMDGKHQIIFPADVCRLVRPQPPAPANSP